MVAKVLLHKFIRLKKLLLFLLVSVLILFYVCLTDNMVFMQGYTTRKAELQASLTNPSFKPSRSLGHASTNDESKKMAGKLPLHKMKESTRKVHFNEQLNGQDNTLQNTEGQYPTDLKTSNNHQQKLELHINSNDQRNSVNLIGKVKDKRLIPDDGKLTTIQAIHKRCLGCKKPENAGYYGTDLMALVSSFITLTCLYAIYCDFTIKTLCFELTNFQNIDIESSSELCDLGDSQEYHQFMFRNSLC